MKRHRALSSEDGEEPALVSNGSSQSTKRNRPPAVKDRQDARFARGGSFWVPEFSSETGERAELYATGSKPVENSVHYNGGRSAISLYFKEINAIEKFNHERQTALARQMGEARQNLRLTLFRDARQVSYSWLYHLAERVQRNHSEIIKIMDYDQDIIFPPAAAEDFYAQVQKLHRAEQRLPVYTLKNEKVYPVSIQPKLEKTLSLAAQLPLLWSVEEKFINQVDNDSRINPSVRTTIITKYHQYLSARNELVKSSLPLVISLAKKRQYCGLSLEDLIQEGNLGLIKGAERFDYTRGNKLSTYASWWIKHALTRALADFGRTVRFPVHQVEMIQRVNKVERILLQELGRAPTASEIAEKMECKIRKIKQVLNLSCRYPLSMQEKVGDEDGCTWEEVLTDENSSEPGKNSDADTLQYQMWKALYSLKPLPRRILLARYGFQGEEATLRDLGEQENLSRERIRQVQKETLKKLRQLPEGERLKEFL